MEIVNTSRKIGDVHVMDVSTALKNYLVGNSIQGYTETTKETVKYIIGLYPNIKRVHNKFETEKPDFNPDLLLVLQSNKEIKVNLFYIKGKAAIQPKNLGAKSFLEKYFLSDKLQMCFNTHLTIEYEHYLRSIVEVKEGINVYDKVQDLKRKVKCYYPKKFECEIEPFRKGFLFNLREICFRLLKDEFNEGSYRIKCAFRELLMADNTNIITRYTDKNKCLFVEKLETNLNVEQGVSIYKKGNHSIGIRSGEEALILRFKFESSPASSVKLATSYEKFPEEQTLVHKNMDTILSFESIISKHTQLESKNISNAIGKCNEAMVYYQILKSNPIATQVDSEDYQLMLKKYSPVISHEDLLALQESSKITMNELNKYLQNKYGQYKIDGIQLVPDNYLKDRLDTSDLQLILLVGNQYVEEAFSLKAMSKKTAKITAKNPGIGQILGPQYFDIGSLSSFVTGVQEQFLQNLVSHQQSLKEVSKELGEKLLAATQSNLRKGVQAILGNSTLIITFYKHNQSVVLEHGNVSSEITVCPQHPTPIQTTLYWNEEQEELSLRVKFSAGQKKGWSSLKLACEFKLNV